MQNEASKVFLASTHFLDWMPVATNTPAGSRFDYLDTLGSAGGPPAPSGVSPNGILNGLKDWPGGPPGNAGQRPALPHRYFRAAMLEHLFDGMKLSLNPTNHRATLTVSNAQPAHTLVLQATADFRHWQSLATNTPATVLHWQFLDTNAPAFNKRFYRAVGQGK